MSHFPDRLMYFTRLYEPFAGGHARGVAPAAAGIPLLQSSSRSGGRDGSLAELSEHRVPVIMNWRQRREAMRGEET